MRIILLVVFYIAAYAARIAAGENIAATILGNSVKCSLKQKTRTTRSRVSEVAVDDGMTQKTIKRGKQSSSVNRIDGFPQTRRLPNGKSTRVRRSPRGRTKRSRNSDGEVARRRDDFENDDDTDADDVWSNVAGSRGFPVWQVSESLVFATNPVSMTTPTGAIRMANPENSNSNRSSQIHEAILLPTYSNLQETLYEPPEIPTSEWETDESQHRREPEVLPPKKPVYVLSYPDRYADVIDRSLVFPNTSSHNFPNFESSDVEPEDTSRARSPVLGKPMEKILVPVYRLGTLVDAHSQRLFSGHQETPSNDNKKSQVKNNVSFFRKFLLVPVSKDLYMLKDADEDFRPRTNADIDNATSAVLAFKAHLHHNAKDVGKAYFRGHLLKHQHRLSKHRASHSHSDLNPAVFLEKNTGEPTSYPNFLYPRVPSQTYPALIDTVPEMSDEKSARQTADPELDHRSPSSIDSEGDLDAEISFYDQFKLPSTSSSFDTSVYDVPSYHGNASDRRSHSFELDEIGQFGLSDGSYKEFLKYDEFDVESTTMDLSKLLSTLNDDIDELFTVGDAGIPVTVDDKTLFNEFTTEMYSFDNLEDHTTSMSLFSDAEEQSSKKAQSEVENSRTFLKAIKPLSSELQRLLSAVKLVNKSISDVQSKLCDKKNVVGLSERNREKEKTMSIANSINKADYYDPIFSTKDLNRQIRRRKRIESGSATSHEGIDNTKLRKRSNGYSLFLSKLTTSSRKRASDLGMRSNRGDFFKGSNKKKSFDSKSFSSKFFDTKSFDSKSFDPKSFNSKSFEFTVDSPRSRLNRKLKSLARSHEARVEPIGRFVGSGLKKITYTTEPVTMLSHLIENDILNKNNCLDRYMPNSLHSNRSVLLLRKNKNNPQYLLSNNKRDLEQYGTTPKKMYSPIDPEFYKEATAYLDVLRLLDMSEEPRTEYQIIAEFTTPTVTKLLIPATTKFIDTATTSSPHPEEEVATVLSVTRPELSKEPSTEYPIVTDFTTLTVTKPLLMLTSATTEFTDITTIYSPPRPEEETTNAFDITKPEELSEEETESIPHENMTNFEYYDYDDRNYTKIYENITSWYEYTKETTSEREKFSETIIKHTLFEETTTRTTMSVEITDVGITVTTETTIWYTTIEYLPVTSALITTTATVPTITRKIWETTPMTQVSVTLRAFTVPTTLPLLYMTRLPTTVVDEIVTPITITVTDEVATVLTTRRYITEALETTTTAPITEGFTIVSAMMLTPFLKDMTGITLKITVPAITETPFKTTFSFDFLTFSLASETVTIEGRITATTIARLPTILETTTKETTLSTLTETIATISGLTPEEEESPVTQIEKTITAEEMTTTESPTTTVVPTTTETTATTATLTTSETPTTTVRTTKRPTMIETTTIRKILTTIRAPTATRTPTTAEILTTIETRKATKVPTTGEILTTKIPTTRKTPITPATIKTIKIPTTIKTSTTTKVPITTRTAEVTMITETTTIKIPTIIRAFTTTGVLITTEALISETPIVTESTIAKIPTTTVETLTTTKAPITTEILPVIETSTIEIQTKIPTTIEAPSTTKTPITIEVLTTTEISTTIETASTAKTPTTIEFLTTTGIPTTIETPSTTKTPITIKVLTSTKIPTTIETPSTTKTPTTIKVITTTQIPTTIETRSITATLTTIETPFTTTTSTTIEALTITETLTTIEVLTTTGIPTTIETACTTETPITIEILTSTKIPTTIETPSTIKTPTTIKVITTTQIPTTIETRSTTATLTTIETPFTTTTSTTIEALTITETLTTIEVLTTTGIPTTIETACTTETPITIEILTSTKIPTTIETPSTTETPTTIETRCTTATPTTVEVLTTTEVSTTIKTPSTAKIPTTIEALTTIETLTTIEMLTTTGIPTTIESLSTTETPTTIEVITSTQIPTTIETRSTTATPTIVEVLTTTEVSTTIKTPSTAKIPTTIEALTTIETLTTIEMLTTTGIPTTIESLSTTETPTTIEVITSTQIPTTIETRSTTATPTTIEVLTTTEVSTTIETPSTAKIPTTIEVLTTTGIRTTIETPSTTETPITIEVLTSTKIPTTIETPSTTKTPTTIEVLPTTQIPTTIEIRSTTATLTTIEALTTTETLTTIKMLTTTRIPTTIEPPSTTETPITIEVITSTQIPTSIEIRSTIATVTTIETPFTTTTLTTSKALATTKTLTTIEVLTTTGIRTTIETPSTTETPITIEILTSTKIPTTMETPSTTETPTTIEVVTSTQIPTIIEPPSTTKTPTTIEILPTTQIPTTIETRSTTATLTTIEALTTTETLTTIKMLTTTRIPTTIEAPSTTETPITIEVLTSTKIPTSIETSSTTETLTTIEVITSTQIPTTVETRSTTATPTTIEVLTTNETLTTIEMLTTTGIPTTIETPSTVETSTITEVLITKIPTIIETQSTVETPTTPFIETTVQFSTSTSTVATTETMPEVETEYYVDKALESQYEEEEEEYDTEIPTGKWYYYDEYETTTKGRTVQKEIVTPSTVSYTTLFEEKVTSPPSFIKAVTTLPYETKTSEFVTFPTISETVTMVHVNVTSTTSTVALETSTAMEKMKTTESTELTAKLKITESIKPTMSTASEKEETVTKTVTFGSTEEYTLPPSIVLEITTKPLESLTIPAKYMYTEPDWMEESITKPEEIPDREVELEKTTEIETMSERVSVEKTTLVFVSPVLKTMSVMEESTIYDIGTTTTTTYTDKTTEEILSHLVTLFTTSEIEAELTTMSKIGEDVVRDEQKKRLLQEFEELKRHEKEMAEREKKLKEKERQWDREKKKHKEKMMQREEEEKVEKVTTSTIAPVVIDSITIAMTDREAISTESLTMSTGTIFEITPSVFDTTFATLSTSADKIITVGTETTLFYTMEESTSTTLIEEKTEEMYVAVTEATDAWLDIDLCNLTSVETSTLYTEKIPTTNYEMFFTSPAMMTTSASTAVTEREYDKEIENLKKRLREKEHDLEEREKMLLERERRLEEDMKKFEKYTEELEREEIDISTTSTEESTTTSEELTASTSLTTPMPPTEMPTTARIRFTMPVEQTTEKKEARTTAKMMVTPRWKITKVIEEKKRTTYVPEEAATPEGEEEIVTKRICLNVLANTTIPYEKKKRDVVTKKICLPYFPERKKVKKSVGQLGRKILAVQVTKKIKEPRLNLLLDLQRRKRRRVAETTHRINNLQFSHREWPSNENTKSVKYFKDFIRMYEGMRRISPKNITTVTNVRRNGNDPRATTSLYERHVLNQYESFFRPITTAMSNSKGHRKRSISPRDDSIRKRENDLSFNSDKAMVGTSTTKEETLDEDEFESNIVNVLRLKYDEDEETHQTVSVKPDENEATTFTVESSNEQEYEDDGEDDFDRIDFGESGEVAKPYHELREEDNVKEDNVEDESLEEIGEEKNEEEKEEEEETEENNYDQAKTPTPVSDVKILVDPSELGTLVGKQKELMDQAWPTEKSMTYDLGGTRYWELKPQITEIMDIFSTTTDTTTKTVDLSITRTTCLYVVLKNERNHARTKHETRHLKIRSPASPVRQLDNFLRNVTSDRTLGNEKSRVKKSVEGRNTPKYDEFPNTNELLTLTKGRKLFGINENKLQHRATKHKDTRNIKHNDKKPKLTKSSHKLRDLNSHTSRVKEMGNCVVNKKNSDQRKKMIAKATVDHHIRVKNSNDARNYKKSARRNVAVADHKNKSARKTRGCVDCICDIVDVINHVKSILDRLNYPLDQVKAFNCSRYKEIQDKIVISVDSDVEEDARVFPQPRYNTESLKGQKYIKSEDLGTDSKGDLALENDHDIISLPGLNLNVPCNQDGDDGITWLSSVSRPSYTWKRTDGIALYGFVAENGDLELRNVNAKDTGNYTCVVTYTGADNEEPMEVTYEVRLRVVTLPRYILHGEARYRVRFCDERALDALATYLPLKLNNVLCEADICNAYVLTPSCSRSQITMNVLIVPSHIVKLTTIDHKHCNVFCLKAIQDKLSLILSKNLQIFLEKAIIFRLPHFEQKLVPIAKQSSLARRKRGKNGESASGDEFGNDIGLFSSCPAGYGLRGTHCVPCDVGTYSEDGISRCKRCPPGTYQPNHGARVCRTCTSPLTRGCYNMLWNSFSAVMVTLASFSVMLSICLLVLWVTCCAKKKFCAKRIIDVISDKDAFQQQKHVEEQLLIMGVSGNEDQQWDGEHRVKRKRGKFNINRKRRKQSEKKYKETRMHEDEWGSHRVMDAPINCLDSYRSHEDYNNHYPKQSHRKGPCLPERDFDT